MQERPLDGQKQEQNRWNLESGMKLLKGNNPGLDTGDVSAVVDALCRGVEDESVFMLEAAAIFIDCILKTTDWKVVTLAGEKLTAMALVSPDGAYCLYPELVAGKASRDPGGNLFRTIYDHITRGTLPPSNEGTYTVIG